MTNVTHDETETSDIISKYVSKHLYKHNRTQCLTTQYVIQRLQNAQPIVFTKFGDGEVQCMQFVKGTNCDGDQYTVSLGTALETTFILLCDMANDKSADGEDRILIGRWHYANEVNYLSKLYIRHLLNQENILISEIPFVDYHLIYNDDDFNKSQNMYNFVEAIQKYPFTKVLITNRRNRRLSKAFKTQHFIEIPSRSWYDQCFSEIYFAVLAILRNNPKALILIAGGLASKVLICNLCEKYPEASFLDIGSGFDILATEHCTRDHKHTYMQEYLYFRNLLPLDW